MGKNENYRGQMETVRRVILLQDELRDASMARHQKRTGLKTRRYNGSRGGGDRRLGAGA